MKPKRAVPLLSYAGADVPHKGPAGFRGFACKHLRAPCAYETQMIRTVPHRALYDQPEESVPRRRIDSFGIRTGLDATMTGPV